MSAFIESLAAAPSPLSAELRPPKADLESHEGMDAWIDTYHAVRRLTRGGTMVFLTDSAVGTSEEDNLRHLVTNLGADVPRSRVAPFLTSKHSFDYCLSYANRAVQHGFPALVVLGGDKHVGIPRCVEHACQLRAAIRARQPGLVLGGWANPHADPSWQAELLASPQFTGEFYLTQVVSHFDAAQVERFVREAERSGVTMPGVFGVFYYRSANPKTLRMLRDFLPVPVEQLEAEFAAGASSIDVAARSIRELMAVGARRFYVSNLPLGRAVEMLGRILEQVQPA